MLEQFSNLTEAWHPTEVGRPMSAQPNEHNPDR